MRHQFKYFNAILFNDNSIEAIRSYNNLKLGVINLLLGVFILSLPLTSEEIYTTHISYLQLLIKFLAAIIVCFVFAKLMGSKSNFTKFFYTISTVNLFASIPIAMISYVCLFVFEKILNIAAVSNFILSVIPYYLFILFAFSVEGGAHIQNNKKSVLLGLFSICLIYTLYFFL